MEFKDPKFLGYKEGKLYFDITVVDGKSEIPYTYLDNDNPKHPIDIMIKDALKNGKLVIDTTIKEEQTKVIDLWTYRNKLYLKFKEQFYEILKISYVTYKDHLFGMNDLDLFNAYFIINKKINFYDLQNTFIELNQDDFKNIITLIMEKREKIMLRFIEIKEQVFNFNTKKELDSIQWNLDV